MGSSKVLVADRVQYTSKFYRSAHKLFRKNKQIKEDLKKTIEDLEKGTNAEDPKYRNGHNFKNVPKSMRKFLDVHFTDVDNNLILLYKYENDGTLRILDLQNIIEHDEIDRERSSNLYLPYDSDKFFKESYSKDERREELFETYWDLMDAVESHDSTEYEEGYLDGMYDIIHAFGLERYFEE